ncbi:unnamed protein product [Phaeothamnion confervicola]
MQAFTRRALGIGAQLLEPSWGTVTVGVRHATKKAGGSTKNGRDSIGKRLGVKKFGGEAVLPGNIIVRQRGCTMRPGSNVGKGNDYTLFSLVAGHVRFRWDRLRKQQIVHVDPVAVAATAAAAEPLAVA